MKKIKYSLYILLISSILLLGCETQRNEKEVAKALEMVNQIPLPARYSQYDGRPLVPQGIKVDYSQYNQYDGRQYYRFTCEYRQPNTNWFMQVDYRNQTEVILVNDGRTFLGHSRDKIDAWYSLGLIESETDTFSWQ